MVSIPKGAGVRRIKGILGDQGIIGDDVRFLVLFRLLSIAERDDPPTLRAGEFRVPQGLTPLQVIRFLDTAKPVHYRVTVPEGRTMKEVADIFAEGGWVDPALFLQLCRDRKFIRELGILANSLEGYLFPDTYAMVRDEVDERSVIRSMTSRYLSVWQDLSTQEKPGAIVRRAKLTRHELLILASIVEKETGSAGERDRIAGVFYNRLRKGMRLQSDPTTIYGIHNFNGNLTKADLKRKTAYNTYAISGLPAGPICNPGAAAMQAVLHPAWTSSLYFVSRNDGSHYFSRTLKQHNLAVNTFQKRRRKK